MNRTVVGESGELCLYLKLFRTEVSGKSEMNVRRVFSVTQWTWNLNDTGIYAGPTTYCVSLGKILTTSFCASVLPLLNVGDSIYP